MYVITDSYGTRQTAWTRRTAMAWLAVCSPDAQIAHRLTGMLIASRSYVRV